MNYDPNCIQFKSFGIAVLKHIHICLPSATKHEPYFSIWIWILCEFALIADTKKITELP